MNEESKAPEKEATQKRPVAKRKKWVALGVIAAVVIVAGVGFTVWHSQPSFCNAICHSPMGPYVEGYSSNDSTKLICAHAEAGNTCLQCHDPEISTQGSEAMNWVSGNYYDPLESRSSEFATREFCFTCHNDGNPDNGEDWDAIVAATANWGGSEGTNPHASHMENPECGTCHSVHGQSQMECAACHYNIEVPEGWTVRGIK